MMLHNVHDCSIQGQRMPNPLANLRCHPFTGENFPTSETPVIRKSQISGQSAEASML